jgi:16S rRNA (cytosine1402-N4)-methyltransferase
MGISVWERIHETMADNALHIPVNLDRVIELLGPALSTDGAIFVDATLGMAGHSRALLERFPGLTLIGLDRDEQALTIARKNLAEYADRVTLVHTEYDQLGVVLKRLGVDEVAGILFDLGVSSLQLDTVDRGFAYSKDAPLDMRMDATAPLTAERVIAEYSESELRRIFYEYGEERLAPRFASKIVQHREAEPIVRSAQLVAIIDAATPAAVQRSGHPAKRVFQALRIEVNQELAVLEHAIPVALDALAIGGRIVVLAYHSLEDRIVKRSFAARSSSTAPAGLPVELAEHRPEFRLLVRGSEQASNLERESNPRSASVRLRAAEKMRRAA